MLFIGDLMCIFLVDVGCIFCDFLFDVSSAAIRVFRL